MKKTIVRKIAILFIINIFLSYICNVFCYAATNETNYQGFKIVKRYNSPTEPEYWITGISVWKTTEIKVPGIADDNIEIKAIYDNTKSTGVFQGNPWLETVDLSESNIDFIGPYCFYNCKSLTNYINSPKLDEISTNAFQNANLNSLTLNEGLEKIQVSAFEDAFSDENDIYIVDIPETVTSIGENAFKVTNKNYRVVLVGTKGSIVEEYCETDSKCTFLERGNDIPTVEELIQEEIRKEKSKLFINTDFTYGNYNNTDKANIIRNFRLSTLSTNISMQEKYNDIIQVDDGFIVVGDSYLYKYDSEYVKETYGNQIKGNQDAVIVKYDYNLSMKWFQSFGGSLNDQFHKIYKTKDGSYLLFGMTCSNDKDLLNINYNTSNYCDVVVKYDENFKIIETKMQTHEEAYEEYKDLILEEEKGNVSNGKIELDTISDGKLGVGQGINGDEMNAVIRKYDNEGYLEWEKLFDKDTNHTNDKLVKVVEVDDGYVFVGSSNKTVKNSQNVEVFQQDAIIVKYNKPYDRIIINGLLQFDMNVDEQKSVDVFYVPWEDVTIGDMQWTSENEEVATVDYKGNIYAKGEGSTKITLNIRGKTQQMIVNVTDPSLVHIENIGDINGDDKVNIKDWNMVYNHINETSTLSDEEFERGDVNKDEKVNIKDWNRMYDHITEVNPLW